jgi:hypothetical protein
VTSISAPSPQDHEPGKADTEQRGRGRLGYGGCDFCDDDLAVTSPKIGHQDLVYAGIEGATTATWVSNPEAATMDEGAATAAIASAPTGTAKAGSTASASTEAAAGRACAPSETGERATTVSRGAVSTSAEKATAATAPGTASTIAPRAGPLAEAAGTAVRTGETTLAGNPHRGKNPATATTAGDDERRVTGTDHESAATTGTTPVI